MLILLGFGCAAAESPVTEDIYVDEEVLQQERPAVDGALTSVACQDAGGLWEGCGSACRGQDADVCVTVCAEYCECLSDDQCPTGYSCGEFIEDSGICLPI